MTKPEIKKEIEKLQETDFNELEYDYEKMNKLRFKYDFLQLQLVGIHMLESIEEYEDEDVIDESDSE